MKNRFGKYFARAKRGETIYVTHRGKSGAKLVPDEPPAKEAQTVEQVLDRLEAEGLIRRGRQPFRERRLVKAKGKPASRMIIEDRR